VQIEVLAEALATKGGRLARGDRVLHDARAPSSAAAHAAVRPAVSSAPPPTARAKIEGAQRWNQVCVSRVTSKMVRIDVGKKHYRRTHVDLGMAHKRTRAPTRQWELLIEFCLGHGYFKSWRFADATATRKLVERLGKDLRAVLGLEDSPFHRYRRDTGWRTKFVARPDLPDGSSEGDDD
jgi:hypothetical protein